MGYSEAFINRTKAQLLEHNRKLSREIAALNKEHDIQVESYRKVVAENQKLHDELSSKEASNKKLADQFYDYRNELVKVRKELADAIEKRDSFKVELEGVRGALNREAEMRVKAEKKANDLEHVADDLEKQRRELEDWKTGQENNLKEVYRNHDELSNKAWKWDKIHELMNAHGIDTMSKLKDALVELEHKREDVESLKTSLADSCAAKIKEGHDLTSKIEFLKENLKKMTDSRDWYVKEAAKLRKWYDDLKKLYDKARKEGEEGCAMWREDAWKAKDDRDFYKKAYEAAAKKNDELQCEVNRLTQDNTTLHDRVNILEQRWTDKFNPEDEMLGRKVLEWQDINAVLAKHNIENSMVLGAELDTLKEYRKVLDKHSYAADGFIGPGPLDESLEKLERFQQMLRDWHFKTIAEFNTYINRLHNYEVICGQNLIGSTDELKKSLDELKAFRLRPIRSLGEDWRDVVDKYHVASPNELDKCLDQRQRMHHTLHVLKKDIEQFNQP